MSTARLHVVATALAAVLLTCAGCGSEEPESQVKLGGDPAPSTASTSPSPTSDPDAPTKPELPAAATAKTEAGRIAFARYFVEAYAYGLGSNDASAVMDVALPDTANYCGTCQAYAKYLDKMDAKGQVRRPWQLPIKNVVDTGEGQPGVFVVDVIVDRPELWDVDEAGTKHRIQKAQPTYLMEIGMTRTGNAWKATGWVEKAA